MRTVWKYPLKPTGRQIIEAPIIQVLTVRSQMDVATLWALVDTEKESKKSTFEIVKTGEPLPTPIKNWKFVGMFFQDGGKFVGHVFQFVG